MKKMALWTLISTMTATSLLAKDTAKYELSTVVGSNIFDSSSKMEDDFFYGIRASMLANEVFGYRLSYERADDVKYDSSCVCAKSTDLQRITGEVLIRGEKEYSIVPYLIAGVGYEILGNETKYDVSQGFVNGGIGFKYHMTNQVNVSLEGKAYKKFDTNDLDFAMNLGLGYTFGMPVEVDAEDATSVLDEAPRNHYNQTHDDAFVNPSQPMSTHVQEKAEFASLEELELQEQVVEDEIKNPKHLAPISQKSKPKISTNGTHYFVQMAAVNQKESTLLSQLSQKGYPFIVEDATREGKKVKLVLVGPYKSQQAASKVLPKLRQIKKDAFITRIQ